jgi:DNA-binding MarR family transcriptional regulator|tara:strand:- start:1127 stop:1618 length:492 start_codon:yes stop_codon:yes gene_type:complete
MRNPDQSIGFSVNDVARLLRRNFNRRAQELGLSQATWQALAYLSRQEGVNQVTLAESLEVQPITLARLIDRLQEAGLVARRPDPADRRAVNLYLTPEAEPLLARMWALAEQTREDALVGLSQESRKVLIETLHRMRQNLVEAENRVAASAKPKDEFSNATGNS